MEPDPYIGTSSIMHGLSEVSRHLPPCVLRHFDTHPRHVFGFGNLVSLNSRDPKGANNSEDRRSPATDAKHSRYYVCVPQSRDAATDRAQGGNYRKCPVEKINSTLRPLR